MSSQTPRDVEPKIPYHYCLRMLQPQARAERTLPALPHACGPSALPQLGLRLELLFTKHRSDSLLHLISAGGCFPGTDAFAQSLLRCPET